MSRSNLTTNVHLGIISMLAGIGLLSTMDAAAKLLVESGLNPIQIIALRSLLIVPAMLLIFAWRGQLVLLKPTRRYWQALRGLTGFIAPFCFFLSLRYLPLSDTVVVFFSSTFVTTILSVLILRERVGIHRWAAVAIGYVGVVIAMAPQGQGQLAGYLLALASGLSYAFLFVSGRLLSSTESVSSMVFAFNIGTGLLSLLLLPMFWVDMDNQQIILLLVLAVFALAGHFALTAAFTLAPASIIAPFEYSALIWALGFDYLIWQQLPGTTTWAGATLIIISGLYVLYRERLHANASAVS